MKFLLFFILLFSSLFGEIHLTQEEKEWIKNNTVVVGVESWEPIVFLNQEGKIDGVSGEILQLAAKKLNLKIEYTSNNWDLLLGSFKNKKIDILPATYYTEERASYGLFTKEYFSIKEYIFLKQENNTIFSFDDLENKKIAVIKEYGTIPKIKEKYPKIQIIETKDMEQSINYLLEGKVDGYIDAQIGVLNYLNKNIIAGVKGISQNQFDPSPLYFFINSDKPILQIILNKALEDITPQEIKSIISKWIHATNQRSNKTLHLTKAQKEYLQKNKKFTMCNNPNWAPLEFKENGKMQGIAIDYLLK